MKKVCLVLLVLSVVMNIVLATCLWQMQPFNEIVVGEIPTHSLDISLEESLHNSLQHRLTYDEYSYKWREEMERYLEFMHSELSAEHWELVAKSQESWLMFEDRDMELFLQAISQREGGGSIVGDFQVYRRFETYRNRTLHLMRMYEYLTTERIEG